MATYGEIRFRLSKMAPGTDLDILDGLIQDRYEEILDRLDWDRRMITSTLQTEDEYTTGTISVTNGLSTVSGSGTVWDPTHTGRMIRINDEEEYYGFTRTSDTAGTLERPFGGDTSATATYRMNRNVYTLPSDVRKMVTLISFALGEKLQKVSQREMNDISPRRDTYGSPKYWSPYMDATSDPPVLQVELFPIPTELESFRYDAFTDVSRPSWSSVSLLPWVRPGALVQGVLADVARLGGSVAQAESHEQRFRELVGEMVIVAARRSGPSQMQTAKWLTAHESRRYLR